MIHFAFASEASVLELAGAWRNDSARPLAALRTLCFAVEGDDGEDGDIEKSKRSKDGGLMR